MIARFPVLLAPLVLLAACAGMNQAVTVVPTAMDDLAARSEGFRRGRAPAERVEPPPGPF